MKNASDLLFMEASSEMWKCGCQEAILEEGEKTQELRVKVTNLNLTFLVEISMYRGGQERGTTESIYTHL